MQVNKTNTQMQELGICLHCQLLYHGLPLSLSYDQKIETLNGRIVPLSFAENGHSCPCCYESISDSVIDAIVQEVALSLEKIEDIDCIKLVIVLPPLLDLLRITTRNIIGSTSASTTSSFPPLFSDIIFKIVSERSQSFSQWEILWSIRRYWIRTAPPTSKENVRFEAHIRFKIPTEIEHGICKAILRSEADYQPKKKRKRGWQCWYRLEDDSLVAFWSRIRFISVYWLVWYATFCPDSIFCSMTMTRIYGLFNGLERDLHNRFFWWRRSSQPLPTLSSWENSRVIRHKLFEVLSRIIPESASLCHILFMMVCLP